MKTRNCTLLSRVRIGCLALAVVLGGAYSRTSIAEEKVRIVQPPSPATDAVYVQVLTSQPEAPPPVIEISLDGVRWSRPRAPLMMVRANEYAVLLNLRRLTAAMIYLRAYPKRGSSTRSSVVRVQINHIPTVSASYRFSRESGTYFLDASGSSDSDPGDSIVKIRWKFEDGTTLEGLQVTKPAKGESAPLPGYIQVFDSRDGMAELHFVLSPPSALGADNRLMPVPPAEKCECVPGSLKFVTSGDSTLNPGRPLGSDYKAGDSLPLDADGYTSGTVFLHAGFEVTAQVQYVEGEKKPCPEMQLAMRTAGNSVTSFFKVFDGNVALPYPFVDTPQDRDFGLDGYQHEYKAKAGKRNPAAPHKLTGGDSDADAVDVVAKKHDGKTITWYDEPGVDIAAGSSPLVTGYYYRARFKAMVGSCVKTMKIEWDVDRYGKVVTESMMEE